jgi:hypothetical protein
MKGGLVMARFYRISDSKLLQTSTPDMYSRHILSCRIRADQMSGKTSFSRKIATKSRSYIAKPEEVVPT